MNDTLSILADINPYNDVAGVTGTVSAADEERTLSSDVKQSAVLSEDTPLTAAEFIRDAIESVQEQNSKILEEMQSATSLSEKIVEHMQLYPTSADSSLAYAYGNIIDRHQLLGQLYEKNKVIIEFLSIQQQ